jgi:hypothetical protein
MHTKFLSDKLKGKYVAESIRKADLKRRGFEDMGRIELAQVSITGGKFLANWTTMRLQSWISRARLYWAGVSAVNVVYNKKT